MNKKYNYNLRKYKKEDMKEIFELMRFIYPEEKYNNFIHRRRKMWEWEFLENPLIKKGEEKIWVAEDSGKIIGHVATMPVKLKCDDKYYIAHFAMDLIVDSAYRGKGIGQGLMEAWRDSSEIAIGLGLTPAVLPIYYKLGWKVFNTKKVLVKVFKSRKILKKLIKKENILLRTGEKLINSGLKAFNFVLSKPLKVDWKSIFEIYEFDSKIDIFWEKVKDDYNIALRKSKDYLNWKYTNHPYYQYKKFYYMGKDGIKGYVVLRESEEEGYCEGHIVDMMTRADDFKSMGLMVAWIIDYFRKNGVECIYFMTTCANQRKVLLRNGFLPLKRGPVFSVYSHDKDLLKRLWSFNDWFLTKDSSDLEISYI